MLNIPAPPRRDIVVVGASAGGVDALMSFFAALPLELDAAILVVLHIPPNTPSLLDRVLVLLSEVRGVDSCSRG